MREFRVKQTIEMKFREKVVIVQRVKRGKSGRKAFSFSEND